jgi:hypothetical protein
MSVLREVLAELWSMFVGDRRLTLLLLVAVGASAIAATFLSAHFVAAGLLLAGALAVLTDSVLHAARRSRGR